MGKSMPVDRFARGVDIDQLRGHCQHCLSCPFLNTVPGATAQPIEFRLSTISAYIALNEVNSFDRHIHRVISRVLQVEEVTLDISNFHVLHAAVFPDTVLDMHDEVVGMNFVKVE